MIKHYEIFKTPSGLSTGKALVNHTIFSPSQTGETVPLMLKQKIFFRFQTKRKVYKRKFRNIRQIYLSRKILFPRKKWLKLIFAKFVWKLQRKLATYCEKKWSVGSLIQIGLPVPLIPDVSLIFRYFCRWDLLWFPFKPVVLFVGILFSKSPLQRRNSKT